MTLNGMLKNIILWLVLGILLVSVFSNFQPRETGQEELSYSNFLKQVDQGNVGSVNIDNQNQMIHGIFQNKKTFSTLIPMDDQYLLGALLKKM